MWEGESSASLGNKIGINFLPTGTLMSWSWRILSFRPSVQSKWECLLLWLQPQVPTAPWPGNNPCERGDSPASHHTPQVFPSLVCSRHLTNTCWKLFSERLRWVRPRGRGELVPTPQLTVRVEQRAARANACPLYSATPSCTRAARP